MSGEFQGVLTADLSLKRRLKVPKAVVFPLVMTEILRRIDRKPSQAAICNYPVIRIIAVPGESVSAVEAPPVLDAVTAHAVTEPIDIVVVKRASGEEIERLSVLRYGGHYRVDGIH